MREHRAIRPDPQVRTREGSLLLVIEVRDTHPVGPKNAEIYELFGVVCLELRAVHGLNTDGVFNAETMWGSAAASKSVSPV